MKPIINPIVYVICYLLLMIPTYILPYFGSNSSVVNAISTAVGFGPTPQWWMHVWFLVMLVLLTWLRGAVTSKKHLVAFAIVAAVFDMAPGLSMIPLVPTVMHLLAIIMGATASTATDDEHTAGIPKAVLIIAAATTCMAVLGSLLFVTTKPSKGKETISPPVAATMRQPTPVPTLPPPTPSTAPAHQITATTTTTPQKVSTQQEQKSAPTTKPANKPVAPKPRTETAPKEVKQEVRYIRLND
jgi:hypothetical protein